VVNLLTGQELQHRRVYTAIADEIAASRIAPGERLPAERTLCERLSVSRATLRRALKELVADGLIEAHVGRGTFVASTPLGETPNTLLSFTELGSTRGLVATAHVLSSIVRAATLDESDAFQIAPGAEIFELQRVRLLDGAAVSVDRSRVPLGYAPALPQVDFESASLYAVLREHGSAPARADYSVQAIAADERQARLLGVTAGAPVLLCTTEAYDHRRSLVELAEMTYRGDRYRFRATLTSPRS
jgi:GntR family transcriptional regulator